MGSIYFKSNLEKPWVDFVQSEHKIQVNITVAAGKIHGWIYMKRPMGTYTFFAAISRARGLSMGKLTLP